MFIRRASFFLCILVAYWFSHHIIQFIGYSSLCFADGGAHTIVTCDSDAQAAEEARHNIDQAGAADRVSIILLCPTSFLL